MYFIVKPCEIPHTMIVENCGTNDAKVFGTKKIASMDESSVAVPISPRSIPTDLYLHTECLSPSLHENVYQRRYGLDKNPPVNCNW